MRKLFFHILLSLTALTNFACQEDIILDTEEGEAKIGIYGGITTDLKRHTITISRTSSFYSQEEIDMISNAEVRIIDQTVDDTLFLKETERGVYATEEVAGSIGHTYRLEADIRENGQILHFAAQSAIDSFPPNIDSIQVHTFTMLDIEVEETYKICPFFQSSQRNIYYLFDLKINNYCYTDTLTKKAKLHLGSLSGLYYNGKEMALIYKDLNIYPNGLFNLDQTMEEETLHVGDTISIDIHNVPSGYYKYIGDITGSIGSNPLMGSPTNVRTNIVGKEKEAVGYFYAASSVHFRQIIQSLPLKE